MRCFDDPDIVHVDGSIDPVRDIGTIETELLLADLEVLESRLARLSKIAKADPKARPEVAQLTALQAHLEAGNPVRTFSDHDAPELAIALQEGRYLTDKKIIYVANVSENDVAQDNGYVKALRAYATEHGCECVRICAAVEQDMAGLSDEEAKEFLQSYGLEESSLDRTINLAYHTLGLASYLTAGPKEVRAWTFRRGWKAPKCAGVIHTDFEKGFIRAQVVSFDDYVKYGGESGAREHGVLRPEGKEYEMKDGDVVEFLFN